MKQQTIAFDCSGTLVDYSDNPRPQVIALLKAFYDLDWKIIVWTGGGLGYAKKVAATCGVLGFVELQEKNLRLCPDIAVDDQEVTYGTVNIRV